ncbi:MAG: V-type ATP synthase subunit E [bacterium]|nr:V-type ATP synthase subunit E [bacterium]
MSLEKVFETLENEAKDLRDDLIDKAKREAQQIIKESEDEAENLKTFHIQKMDIKLKGDSARIQIESDLLRKKAITRAKEEFTSKIYSDIEKHLSNIRKDQEAYKKIFKNLLIESLDAVKGTKIIVEVNPKDKDLASSSLKELNLNYTVSADKDYLGGLTLNVNDNRISVSNTLESRLIKSREFLRTQLNEVLFSER